MSTKPETVRYSRDDLDIEASSGALALGAGLLIAASMGAIVAVDVYQASWTLMPQAAIGIVAGVLAFFVRERKPRLGAGLLAAVVASAGLYNARYLGHSLAGLALVVAAALIAVACRPAIGCAVLTGLTGALYWAVAPRLPGDLLLLLLTSTLCWVVPGMLWLYRGKVLSVLDWSWQTYQDMRASLDEALAQRVVLKETQEDLVKANEELARLSERLELMTQIAEDARASKEAFLANVSHELRTPLNIIIGFSEIMTESPEVYGAALPPALLADIAAIQRNSEHLSSLVDDILDLSRADAGRMALTKEWVSLEQIVEAAILAVKPLFDSRALSLTTAIEPDLPPVYGDRTRLRQVLLNLLSNAGRYTEKGGVEVTVRATERAIVCSVRDTGPGIAPEDQERVFEPFRQAGSLTRRRAEGSGLGLSISKRFVELHGGRMWIDSVPGQGTTVSFELPISPAPASGAADVMRWFGADTQYEARTRPSRAPQPRQRPRFVVVESGEVVQRMLRRYYYDADIVPVTDLDAALRALAESPANALLLNDAITEDVLRNQGGLAALPHNTPGVLCWAPSEAELAEQLGVLEYMVKPINRERLLAVLDRLGDAVHRVLIVDDDQEAVQLLARLLKGAPRPYEVLKATRTRRALTLMRHATPDLVLLDLIMPDMDGYEFLRHKRSDERLRQIPVIAITGQVAAASIADGRCVTVVRPASVPLADLLGQVLQVTDALERQPSAIAVPAPPENPVE
ncbi:MAG: ATP-binding protein [Anaerolineales bacterium]